MKYLLILIALLGDGPDLNRIATVNRLKRDAEEAYRRQDYEKAIRNYRTLTDSMGLREDPLLLNLAHACYQASDTANATYYYQRTASSADPVLRSVAQSQLGVLEQQRRQYDAALEHFRQALLSHPGNEEARYNYELLKKLMEQQQEEQQDQKEEQKQDQQQQQQQQQQQKDPQQDAKDQDRQDQQEQSSQQQERKEQPSQDQQPQDTDEEGKKMDQPPASRQELLRELNMTEEKARMILEAMRNSEIQYIQQQQRKPTKKPESGKPDW